MNANELKLFNENKMLRAQVSTLSMKAKNQEKAIKKYEEHMDEMINNAVERAVKIVKKECDKTIQELNNKVLKLESKLNVSSKNSSLPVSKNKIGVSIPNLREKSDKKVGGQTGHKQKKLDYFKEEEIDEEVKHTLSECPDCHKSLEFKNTVISDIIDFDIKVVRTRNKIDQYHCVSCKKDISSNTILPRGCSYGSNINASAIILMNEANVPVNKVRKYFEGLTNKEITMSEGYLSKLQAKCSNQLDEWMGHLKEQIVKEEIVHWDDTVINVGEKQGVLRFYGNEKFAYFIAHENKNKEGIDSDGILTNLDGNTTVVHDHLLYNYNDKFQFKNSECNSHILRYLQGVKDNIHDHKWNELMSELLRETNSNRNGHTHYEQTDIDDIYRKYNEIIQLGYKENKELEDYHFYKEKEYLLISRLDKFKEAHLLFIKDFNVPFTNNTAERSFRTSKTKMKVSGQFKNITFAGHYAKILAYMETCYRNDINKHQAIKRLLDGNPYTISELVTLKK